MSDNYWTDGVSFTPEERTGETRTIEELLREARATAPRVIETTDTVEVEVNERPPIVGRSIISNGYDPYLPIKKSSLSADDTGAHGGYCVQVQKENKEWPGQYSWEVAGNVSAGYLLVPNDEVRDIAMEIADRTPFQFDEAITRFDGKKYTLCMETREKIADVTVGDSVGMGLMFNNSYDGSGAFKVMPYLLVLSCSNGYCSKSYFNSYRFRHTQESAGWQDDVRAAMRMLEMAPAKVTEFARRMRMLRDHKVDQGFLYRMRAESGPAAKVGASDWSAIIDHWSEHEENNQFGFLQAATNVMWHKKKLNLAHIGHNDSIVTGMLGGNE